MKSFTKPLPEVAERAALEAARKARIEQRRLADQVAPFAACFDTHVPQEIIRVSREGFTALAVKGQPRSIQHKKPAGLKSEQAVLGFYDEKLCSHHEAEGDHYDIHFDYILNGTHWDFKVEVKSQLDGDKPATDMSRDEIDTCTFTMTWYVDKVPVPNQIVCVLRYIS